MEDRIYLSWVLKDDDLSFKVVSSYRENDEIKFVERDGRERRFRPCKGRVRREFLLSIL